MAGGGPLGAYLLGLAFAFGWTPCIGPILGAILTVSAVSVTATNGIVLLSLYSLGLGIPFMGRFMADIRAELNSVITGDTSRKFGNFTGGVSYALFE